QNQVERLLGEGRNGFDAALSHANDMPELSQQGHRDHLIRLVVLGHQNAKRPLRRSLPASVGTPVTARRSLESDGLAANGLGTSYGGCNRSQQLKAADRFGRPAHESARPPVGGGDLPGN